MKKIKTIIPLMLALCCAQSQNYIGMADSCFKLKNYACSATNYELFMAKIDPESNGIAYRAALSWSLAKDKEKAFVALNRYVKNNALNNNPFFSQQLIDEKGFSFLRDDVRWAMLIDSVQKGEARVTEQMKKEWEAAKEKWKTFENALDVGSQLNNLDINRDIYPELTKLFVYKSPKPFLTNGGITLFIRVNNADIPFYVHVPENYDPAVASPALIVLHGAVNINLDYPPAAYIPRAYKMTSDHIPGYAKDYIAIHPMGIKTLNWMNTESGFDMVNEIVVYLKSYLNVDDNRIELLGHSNGATGVFTYLVKSPTPYAGFYGMNTHPKVYIGGTFLRNGMTRHFYNFATDKDYYYPLQAIRTIDSLARSVGVNWYTQLNYGYPHWYPAMKESFVPMAKIFEDMVNRVRNPFPKEIYFETDNVKYGTSDWIRITALDTLSSKATWQTDPNFKITEWTDSKDFNKIVHLEEMAFDYPCRSGAIKAMRKGNNIYVETSDISSFAILLNREIVDYRKKINVYVNGRRIYTKKISPDKLYTLSNFKSRMDRKVIWENELDFVVKK